MRVTSSRCLSWVGLTDDPAAISPASPAIQRRFLKFIRKSYRYMIPYFYQKIKSKSLFFQEKEPVPQESSQNHPHFGSFRG